MAMAEELRATNYILLLVVLGLGPCKERWLGADWCVRPALARLLG